jgi:hypothetical protein
VWRPRPAPQPGGPQDVFVTRLHVRYDRADFPEDLVFQETGDRQNFQGRYVLRHPWDGAERCDAAREYRRQLPVRLDREAQTLASLTGWPIADIRERMRLPRQAESPARELRWWERLWGKN